MSGRSAILGRIRQSLERGDREHDAGRRKAVEERLTGHRANVVPARGQLPAAERAALFCQMAEAVSATVARVPHLDDVPAAVAAFLRQRNLPAQVRRGNDPRLAALPWDHAPHLDLSVGKSDGSDITGLAHAFAGVAETGTAVLLSGQDNPSTLNFLPDNHIIVIDAGDIVPDFESVWARLRARTIPRTVNMITGPSRSGDIEQTLLLGAHGPRSLHIIVVDGPATRTGPSAAGTSG